ncbi:MAG: glycosyltransferase [Candidatus Bathyarchaeota archaeon]|nr:glycosyltransferase [Candidatus Bathyarchaeota archaeon]
MTYERPKILLNSIKELQRQTFRPEYILVVDNSESYDTQKAIEKLSNPIVKYHRVGYNSGPAGAASIGLQKLTDKGFKWIYWGDDDNPPKHRTIFENFFSKIEKLSKESNIEVGVFGGRGGNLNKVTGRISSLTNSQLQKADIIEVDVVPGGHTMLVNAEVVIQKVFPEGKLFFGFEELDFCLKVRKKGFKVVVDSEDWLKENSKEGNIAANFKWKGSSFGDSSLLWRNYYSTRNLLYIYFKNLYFFPFLFLLFKSVLKSMVGFRYGLNYGKKNLVIQWKAILHFFTNTYGQLKLK